jgi:hypothetical protein
MKWSIPPTEKLADVLKFLARGAVLICGVSCAVTFTYVVIKVCWFSARWLDRVLFAKPW